MFLLGPKGGFSLFGLYLYEMYATISPSIEERVVTEMDQLFYETTDMGPLINDQTFILILVVGICILTVVLFVAAVVCYRKLKDHAGDTAIVVFSLYGASQILWESMRDDGHMLIIFLRVGQLAAFLMPLICCGILSRRVKSKKLVAAAWLVMVLCVGAVAALEFSLDGRLTFGNPTLARDWGLMAAACAVLFAMPCMLLRKARKQA